LNFVERIFGGGDGLKKKLISAARRIEVHKREVISLRLRLENRRQSLFEKVVRAIEHKDDDSASIFAVELTEVKKVLKVVKVSELALMQIIVRLESIRDVGDVYSNMNDAFKIMRGVNKSVSGVVPSLENATEEVNTTLSETLADLGNLSSSVSLDVTHEGGQELFEKAKLFAEEKALELNEGIPSSVLSANGDSLFEKAKQVAMLANGEVSDEKDFQVTMLSQPDRKKTVDEKVYKYIMNKNKRLNVIDAADALNLPIDEVEKTVFKLVSEGKLKAAHKER
jgi:division protein CdvB (Snf7/Vps24/ESCRT-III family)|tara:strand:- start:38 stop:883 length:846 start_codon:yes stop_codon:yes gene_type:complete